MHRYRHTVLVVLVLVCSVISVGIAAPAAPDPTTNSTPAQEKRATASQGASTNVTFDNQTSNGTTVVVNSTDLQSGGFVVIYAVNTTTVGENATSVAAVNRSTMGDVIGYSTYLEPGTNENVTVTLNQSLIEQHNIQAGVAGENETLNQSLVEDQPLIAVVHRDANGNQQFESQLTDPPFVRDGDPVADWAYVRVRGGTVTAGNQTTATTTPGNGTADA